MNEIIAYWVLGMSLMLVIIALISFTGVRKVGWFSYTIRAIMMMAFWFVVIPVGFIKAMKGD